MNKILISCLLALFCLITNAQQQYSSMLTDGRIWIYYYHVYWESEVAATMSAVFICGDTIIDNRECKKMYNSFERSPGHLPDEFTIFKDMELLGLYDSAWYEEDGKIYRIIKDSVEPVLMFDFAPAAGDKLPQDESLTYWYDDKVTSESVTNINHSQKELLTFRRMRFAKGDITTNPELSDWCLVEGIGGNEGILYTEFQYPPENEESYVLETFADCMQYIGNEPNGHPIFKYLFTRSDFLKAGSTSVNDIRQDPKSEKSSTSYYFDLQGRRITGQPTRGIYIQNGKKVVIK